MPSLKKRFIKETSIYSLEPIFEKGLGFILLPLYTTFLSPSEYGNLEYILTLVSFIVIIVQGGLTSSLIRYGYAETRDDPKVVLFNCILSNIALSILSIIIAIIIAPIMFKNNNLQNIFILALVASLLKNIIINYHLLVLRFQHKATKYLILTSLSVFSMFSLNIFFVAVLKYGIKGIIYSQLITSILLAVFISKQFFKSLTFKININLIKKTIQFGTPLLLGNISLIILNMSDRIFIERFSNSHELGLYGYGYKFGMLMEALILQPFIKSWDPFKWEIFKNRKNAKDIYKRIFEFIQLILLLILFLFSSLLIIAGEMIAFNKEFTKGLIIVPIILSAYLLKGLTNYNSFGVLFKSKTILSSISVVIAALINILGNYFLIPKYGIIGASISTFISFLFYFNIYFYFNQKYYTIPYNKIYNYIYLISICIYAFAAIYIKSNLPDIIFHSLNLFLFLITLYFLIIKLKRNGLLNIEKIKLKNLLNSN